MKVKAVKSFANANISMGLGFVANLPAEVARPLIEAGLVVEEGKKEEISAVKPAAKKKAVKADADK